MGHVILLSYYYRIPIDRDYNKMTEQDCSQLMTCYVENKFGFLSYVTVTPNDEVAIADWENNCIVVLDSKMNLLKVIEQGSGNRPDSVAVSENVIAVSDWENPSSEENILYKEISYQ